MAFSFEANKNKDNAKGALASSDSYLDNFMFNLTKNSMLFKVTQPSSYTWRRLTNYERDAMLNASDAFLVPKLKLEA